MDIRVYYEDTDLAGIVYYANYLRFIERGRTEWVRSIGIDQGKLKSETGLVFAVRRIEADYLRPAVFDDVVPSGDRNRHGVSTPLVIPILGPTCGSAGGAVPSSTNRSGLAGARTSMPS